MKKSLIYTICLICCIFHAAGQTIVTGKVLEKTSEEAIIGANVMVKSKTGNVLNFSTTDKDGRFSLNIPQKKDSVAIEVTAISFMPYYLFINSVNNQDLVIHLEESSIQLNEVVVKADRIRENGDTITYNVASFAKTQDKTIGDVLRRMPGIDVQSGGNIQYQGLDISNLYIEGNNLLGGKYGIATNGISHEDIGAVEVMENHQPLQVLRGISFSERPAINLKLKNKSKATWIINGNAGLGWSNQPSGCIWDAEAFIMTIFPKFQTITTLKSNNVGINLGSQLKDFLSSRRMTDLSSYISLDVPMPPSFKEIRTLFNQSHLFSTSNLWKTNIADLKFQLDYYNQRINSFNTTTTTYFIENGNHIINENRYGTTKESHLNGLLNIELNKKNYYINNSLKTELNWDKTDLETVNNSSILQKAYLPDFYISNDLKIIKRVGQHHLITFSSVNEWESMPQSLTVCSSEIKRSQFQNIKDNALYTKEQAAYNFNLKGFNISCEAGLEGYFREMGNSNDDTKSNSTDISNNISLKTLKIFLSPKIDYTLNRVDFSLQYPINISHYKIPSIYKDTKFLQSPSFNVRWRPNALVSFSINGGFGDLPASLHNIYEGFIMSDYRTFTKGLRNIFVNSRKNISSRFSYRHSPNGLFANIFVMNTWLNTPYQSVRDIKGDNIIYSFIYNPCKTQTLTSICNISKSLDFIHGAISINSSYTESTSSMISENVPTSFSNKILSIGPRINGNICDFANFSYELSYRRAALSISKLTQNTTNNFIHSFSCFVSPLDFLYCEISGEYYNNQLTSKTRKDMLLLDFNLTFNLSKRIQIQASLSNVLNKKSYSYTTFSTLSSIENLKHIRGRELMITLSLTK